MRRMLSIATFCAAILLFAPVPACPQTAPLAGLQHFLRESFPEGCEQIGNVEEKHEDRIAFPLHERSVARGRELLIMNRRDNIPVYLQTQGAVVRMEAVAGSRGLAQKMVQLGEEIKTGDPVIIPMSPVVYLYTNIRDKDSLPVYQELLHLLISGNYEVRELSEGEIEPRTDRYGILVRLEGNNRNLVLKVQSIYSRDTLFSTAWKSDSAMTLEAPIGREVMLANYPAVTRTSPLAAQGSRHTQIPPPERTTGTADEQSFLKATPTVERDYYRLDRPFQRMVAGDIDGDRHMELILLDDHGIEVFRPESGRLHSMGSYRFDNENLLGLHIYATDVTGDDNADLLITLLRGTTPEQTDTQLASMVISFDRGALQVLARNIPYYLRVAEDSQGNSIVLGQAKGKHEPFDGDITILRWDNQRMGFDHPSEYKPAHNVYSIYQFNTIPSDADRVAIMEPNGTLNVYFTPSEKVEASADHNYGEYREIPYKILLPTDRYTGGFSRQSFGTTYAPVRFEYKKHYDDQFFLIDKERSGRSEDLNWMDRAMREKGEDSIVAVRWMGKTIQETWRSQGLAKDILDFTFLSENGKERLMALTRDAQGHAIEVIQ